MGVLIVCNECGRTVSAVIASNKDVKKTAKKEGGTLAEINLTVNGEWLFSVVAQKALCCESCWEQYKSKNPV